MRTVIVESPYAGDIETHVRYARACVLDCLLRGEAPFASHILYTQSGIFDDTIPKQRKLGIDAGLAIGKRMDATVVYTDFGLSPGMNKGIAQARAEGRPVLMRVLPCWKE